MGALQHAGQQQLTTLEESLSVTGSWDIVMLTFKSMWSVYSHSQQGLVKHCKGEVCIPSRKHALTLFCPQGIVPK